MCDPVSLSLAAVGIGTTIALGNKKNNKEKAKANAQINAANQAANKQIEANKIANSVQTTDTTKETPTDLATKLKQQKLPLNTTNTGATVGTPTSVGLNLGGY